MTIPNARTQVTIGTGGSGSTGGGTGTAGTAVKTKIVAEGLRGLAAGVVATPREVAMLMVFVRTTGSALRSTQDLDLIKLRRARLVPSVAPM